jgi:hypothetical protein
MIRSLTCLVVALVCVTVPGGGVVAEDGVPGGTKLDGAWRMTGFRGAEGGEYAQLPEGVRHIKLVAGGRFVWTTAQDGKIIRSAGGKCTVKGDKYTEVIEFTVGEGVEGFVGKEVTFTWKLQDGKWHHTGTVKADDGEHRIDEVWERVKP